MTHRNIYMTDELQAIYDQTVEFVANEVTPHGDQWEEAGKVPRDVLRQMGELGMFSLRVPEQHGGLGMGMLASATFSEALGASTYAGFEPPTFAQTTNAKATASSTSSISSSARTASRPPPTRIEKEKTRAKP